MWVSMGNDMAEIIYHGSQNIIHAPEYGKGKPYNDYGSGFYTTGNIELAGEWAVLHSNEDGYINEYTFNRSGLKVLKLDELPLEKWVAVLMECRKGSYNEIVRTRMEKFVKLYSIELTQYDIIEGWRANDAFFSYVRDFLNLLLSLEKMQEAMKLGEYGTQICLKSKDAFCSKRLVFVNSHTASVEQYYKTAITRDDNARRAYQGLTDKTKGTLLFDMIGRD